MYKGFARRLAAAAVAATAIAAAVWAPGTALASPALTVTGCGHSQVVFGLHGMNEGPSVTKNGTRGASPTLATFQHDLATVNDGLAIDFETVAYPSAKPDTIVQLGLRYVHDGTANLQAAITEHLNSTCPQYRNYSIALVGYSMGAWVVHDWLAKHPSEWKYIDTVALYGDPCYVGPNHDAGLARLFVPGNGCDPASAYPAPSVSEKNNGSFGNLSYTLNLDPVAGTGYHANTTFNTLTLERQLAATIHCALSSGCAHYKYQSGKAGASLVEDGANIVYGRFLVARELLTK